MKRFRSMAFALVAVLGAGTAHAVIPESVPDLPILTAETKVGSILRSAVAPVAPTAKTVDGNVGDWTGNITRLGGSAIYSHGEFVYQDYLMDDWGADDGYDAGRLQTLDTLKGIEPRTYRIDPLQQAAGDQFGAPQPPGAALNYGDANVPGPLRDQSDIEEARVAADASNLYFLVRTTGMTVVPGTAVEVLLDTEPGGSYATPGGITTGAEWAFVVAGDKVLQVTHRGEPANIPPCQDPCAPRFAVATNPDAYTNAVELSISRDVLGELPDRLGVGIATGVVNDTANPTGFAHVATGDGKSDLINVAFRHEPARIWMDREQALALRLGNIDQFLTQIDISKLLDGYSETYQQRPGYYERTYLTNSPVNQEREDNSYFQGMFQHYGIYIPTNYSAGIDPSKFGTKRAVGAMFWMHYRGGHAHDAAAWEPGILRQFGEDVGHIVVTPSARGTSSWYTGRGMEDYRNTWDDVMAHYNVDRSRVYLGGHSMGGWASWFLGLVYPDRWAASNPQDGLLVPGLWLGAGPPSGGQNGADVNAEFLVNILGNARNVPYVIYHGTEDELVPVTSVLGASVQMTQLGYRYRAYLFHNYEHYSAPIWDDWREAVRYMNQFRLDPNPAHVTYSAWPALDHAVSTISAPAGVDLHYTFNSAYWVRALTTRASGIDPSNIAKIDATTYGRGTRGHLAVPEAGAAGQAEPYTMHGLRWLDTGPENAPENRFEATLTNAGSALLDLARMAIGTAEPINAMITTDGATTVKLIGKWGSTPKVETLPSSPATLKTSYNGYVLSITFPSAGQYAIVVHT